MALLVLCGFVATTLVAGWKIVTSPNNWACLAWTAGLVVGVVATPTILRALYEATVLSTFPGGALLEHVADNRRWWLEPYQKTLTRPYGVLAVAAVIGWRLSIGTNVPLRWWWCLLIVVSLELVVSLVVRIPEAPEMPSVQAFSINPWLAAAIVGVFVGAFGLRLIGVPYLGGALFVLVLLVVAVWVTFTMNAVLRLFLRVDNRTSTSYPYN